MFQSAAYCKAYRFLLPVLPVVLLAFAGADLKAQSLRSCLGVGGPDITDGAFDCTVSDIISGSGGAGNFLFLDFESAGTSVTLSSITVDFGPSLDADIASRATLFPDNLDGATIVNESLAGNDYTATFSGFTGAVDLFILRFNFDKRSLSTGTPLGEDYVGATITATLSDGTVLSGSYTRVDYFNAIADLGAPRPKLCLPPHRGVPYDPDPPSIDGRVQEDVGWRGAARLTYGTGTEPPHVAFQGLKHKTDQYLYLSFEVRSDPTFDQTDLVVINFRPSAASAITGNDRRIFIYPLCDSDGAAGPNCNLITPADKLDRPPRLVQVWQDSANWTQLTSGQPTNLEVKVRSYPDGSSNAWNLEVKVPTSVAQGGSEWIDFADDFLFYFNTIRVSGLDNTATEFRWPRNAPEVNGAAANYPFSPEEWGEGAKSNTATCKGVWLTWSDVGTTNTPPSKIEFTTPPPNTVTNTFVATVHNDSEVGGVAQPATDVRVRFRIANWGIPSLGDWADVPVANPGCPDATLESNPTCPQNIPAATSTGPGTQTFNLKWKVPDQDVPEYQANDHQCILVELDSLSDTNITTKSVFRNMDFVTASKFERPAQVSAKWRGLLPEGMPAHEFTIHVTTREEVTKLFPSAAATPSAEARKAPAGRLPAVVLEPGGYQRVAAGEGRQVSLLNWVAHGYRHTGRFIDIQGKRYAIVDPVGSFGYVVQHVGRPVAKWQHKLVGAEKVAENLYRLSIEPEGVARITTQIEPQEYGGLFNWLTWVLLILILILLILWLKQKLAAQP